MTHEVSCAYAELDGFQFRTICGQSDGMGLSAHLESHQRLVP
jgi:hypothetical protein